jgi:hypothetical protein
MDKGKVLRNLYRKKLAEYIQQKEAKGEQETHSETVPVTQQIEKVVPRKRYDIDLEFETKVGNKKVMKPVRVIANLSVTEKRKFSNFAKYIADAIKLRSSAVLVERLNNLLKRIIAESGSYSLDFSQAMMDFIKIIKQELASIVAESARKEGLEGVQNVLNQMNEIFEEKKQVIMPEEGVPAIEERAEEVKIPFKEGEESGKKKIIIRRKRRLEFQPFTDARESSRNKREAIKKKLQDAYEEISHRLQSTEQRNNVFRLMNEFAKRVHKIALVRLNQEFEDLGEQIRGVVPEEEPAAAPAQAEEEEEVEGEGGMRKGRYNTHRGYIGYGHQEMPAFKKGFATAPMNANSPFGQPAFRAPQSNAIPKFLNLHLVPNKKGNFAVLE